MEEKRLIRNHWKSYLGTSMNTFYHGKEFQAVTSESLERPPYNQVVPFSMDSDLSAIRKIAEASGSEPVLHGEKQFIKKFRDQNFPDAEKVREDRWMKFTGEKPEGKDFDNLEFRWIERSETDDYLDVLQEVFGPDDFYIDLHRDPVKVYGEDVFRIVVYDGDRPVAIGEFRLEGTTGFIYSLATIEELQGKGLGTEVLRRLLSKAEGSIAEDVFLMAEASDWLVDFYRDRGFEIEFSVACYSGGTWDEIFS